MIKEELIKLFKNDEDYETPHCTITKTSYGFEIKYGQEYNPPRCDLAILIKLSELFGTLEIDVDNYSKGGCPTCDYGSDYGHTIQVYNPTKNTDIDFLDEDLLK